MSILCTRRSSVAFLVGGIAFASVACRSAATGVVHAVEIRSAVDTVRARPIPNGVSADFSIDVSNGERRSLYYYFACGVELQRDVASVWVTVWVPICVESKARRLLWSQGSQCQFPWRFPPSTPRLSYRLSMSAWCQGAIASCFRSALRCEMVASSWRERKKRARRDPSSSSFLRGTAV